MAHIFGSIWDRFNRNALNDLSKSVEFQGRSIQDLVAKGQLTPAQYEQLLYSVNSLLKNGDVDKYALSESLRKELEAIKDASPKGVYETLSGLNNAYPNGADGIYVVSDNGNWYFWDGSNWVSGGVYQSTSFSDSQIEDIAESAKYKILSNDELKGTQAVEDKHESYLNMAGDIKKGVYNPPGGGEIYRGTMTFVDNESFISNRLFPKNLVFRKKTGESLYPYFLTRITTNKPIAVGFWVKKLDILNLPTDAQISIYLEYRDTANTTFVYGSNIRKSDALNVGYEETKKVGEADFTVRVEREYDGWIYYSAKSTNIPNNQRSAGIRFSVMNLKLNEDGKLEILNYSIIEDADEILPYFVYPANKSEISIPIRELSKLINVGATSKWQGKKWAVLGDSNSNNSALNPYHRLIAEEKGIIVNNRSVGGTGYITKGSANDRARISEQVALVDSDSDLITVLAGVNDYSVGYPLGTISDRTYNTFYGALNLTVEALIERFPLKTIAIITQMPRNNENIPGRASVEEQVNATIDVCRKNSIPVLDLYHAGNIYPKSSVYMEAAKTDGVHLTQLGQEKVASKISHFIETL